MTEQFFNTLNAYFDKIYVITLHRAADRQAHIQKELKGLQYEFFWGKDKNEFKVEELQQQGIYNEALARQHHRFGKSMPTGMIGCSWSHRLVYENIIASQYKKVLILEDDVVIDQEQAALLPQVLQELPTDWELLYFGFAGNEQAPSGQVFKKALYHILGVFGKCPFSHKTINNLYPKQLSSHIYKAGYHDCTHAYALTYTGAQKLARLQQPISFFPDNLLAHAVTNDLVKGYITLPKIINQQYQVVQDGTYSYINQ